MYYSRLESCPRRNCSAHLDFPFPLRLKLRFRAPAESSLEIALILMYVCKAKVQEVSVEDMLHTLMDKVRSNGVAVVSE